MKKRIFLDNAAGAFPKAPGLDQALAMAVNMGTGNINRSTYTETEEAGLAVIDTRELLCKLFNFKPATHVIFTSGVTASLNYIIKGFLQSGDRVLTSSFEHNAVMRPLVQMEKSGVKIDRVPAVLKNGGAFVDTSLIESMIRPETRLAVFSHASNVTGFIQPIEEIAAILKKHNIPLVIDGAQSAGHFPVDLEKIKPAAFCFTGHKGLLGPQGTGGILFDKEFAKRVEPLITGGTGSASDSEVTPSFMPDRFEAGTQNIIGIAGLYHSLKWLHSLGINNIHTREEKLLKLFLDGIKDLPIKIAGGASPENRVGIVSIDFSEFMDNAEAGSILEEKYGILTRCGLHCSPSAHKSIGTFPQGTVRFSTGPFTIEEEIENTVNAIKELLTLKH
ncbi:aminotransferase class V-fold PLP-dependent enzyme [Treponema sp. OMZ 788]|uniref:aminotransferase class V-fold PLP-dependent enzyme n=1 Tax=Treponema sp. OMZ 788 TaxID=2563664 RepID=UPI0020A28E23|nr:aminotransferase class V-fold PLP-dependent enzyme [Treponema sp. OMZ 788]UTC64021.1 aminotransferase class V-fold PLP-dependent enzyme [Treponema sp. OMZ 788]